MTRDREIDGEPKPRAVPESSDRVAYWATFGGLFVGGFLVMIFICRWLRSPFPSWAAFVPGLVCQLATRPLLNRLLRWRGRTPPARQVATWAREPLVPAGEPEAEVVEAGVDRNSLLIGIGAGLFGACFFGGLLLASRSVIPPAQGDGLDRVMVAFMACFVLAALWLLIVGWWIRPTVRVDAAGVWGYPRDLAVRRRFIPWSAIAACDLETWHNPDGKPIGTRPILLGPAGERLIRLDMTGLARADRDRLIRAIAARLPRAVRGPVRAPAPPTG